jgi:hypothetical protein
LPATVAVPIRTLVFVLAVTANVTVPDPVRPMPFWKLRKLLVLVAFQVQLACVVVTVIVPVDAASDTLAAPGLIE